MEVARWMFSGREFQIEDREKWEKRIVFARVVFRPDVRLSVCTYVRHEPLEGF